MNADKNPSGQQMEMVFDYLPYAACLIDAEGKVQAANPACCNITGYRLQELVGRKGTDLIQYPDRFSFSKVLMRTIRSESEVVHIEGCVLPKNGPPVPVRTTLSGLAQNEKAPRMTLLCFEERKEEKILHQTPEMEIEDLSAKAEGIESFFALITDGVAILNESGICLQVNPSLRDIFSLDQDSLPSVYELFEGDEQARERIRHMMVEVLSQGQSTEQIHISDSDHCQRIFEVRSQRINLDGRRCIQVIFEAIPPPKQPSGYIEDSQVQLHSILEAVKSRIFLLDTNGRIIYSNQQSGRLINGPFLGKKMIDFCLNQQERDQLSKAMKECQYTHQNVEYQTSVEGPDETIYDLQVFMTPMIHEGQVTGYTLLRNDVTSINRAKRRSRESEAKLHSVVEATGARIFHLNTEGIITYSNRTEGRVIFGDFIGKKWVTYARSEEEKETWLKAIEACKSQKGPIEFFTQATYLDGSPKYVLQILTPVITDGELTGYTLTRQDITQIELTHQALKENEAKLRTIMDTVHSRILQIDLEGTILYVNKTGNGLSVDELVGTNMTQFAYSEEEKKKWQAVMDMCREQKEPVEFTRLQQYPDGSEQNLLVQMSPVITEEDTVVGFTIIRNDITSIEAANRLLRESEENYRSIVEGSDATIVNVSLDNVITYINKPFPGLKKEDMIGREMLVFFPEEGRAYWEKLKRRVISTKQATNYEYSIPTPDGEKRSFFDILSPRFHKNVIIGFTIISRDITATKRLQREHIEALSVLRATVDATGIGTYEWDVVHTNVITWDDNTHKIFGLKPGEYDGSLAGFMRYVHPEDVSLVEASTEEALHHTDQTSISYRIIREDGEVRWISTRRISIRDERGNALKIKGVTWDITDEKRREETNLRAAKLEVQNQELKEFTYIASHDLQSPLRTIGNFAGILAEDYGHVLGDTGQNYLKIIQEGIYRMRNLIIDLLDYSRIGQEQDKEMTDLNILLQAILKDMHHQVTKANGIIHVHPLPSVSVIKTSFRLLLQNLISNSLKFQAEGTLPQVEISAIKREKEFEFSIRDNGIGIHSDYHNKIFQVFQRLHSDSEYEGTGIGLAHCEKIVALHGGRIWVESAPGQGSTFKFVLPIL